MIKKKDDITALIVNIKKPVIKEKKAKDGSSQRNSKDIRYISYN